MGPTTTTAQDYPITTLRRVVPQIVASLWLPVCFTFAIMNQLLLPDKYFQDSEHIEGLALTATGPSPDSFLTTAWVYRILGGFAFPAITQMVTLALFFVVIFVCASWVDISRFGVTELVLYCFCGVEGAIYLAQFSKESIVLFIVLALVVLPRRWPAELVFLGLVCGYAYLIRSYWFIVAALYLAFRGLLRSTKPCRIPLFAIVAMACLAVGTSVVLRVNLNSFREVVAQSNSLYAQSVIQDYIPVTGPVGGALNALCTLVLLIVPVPLTFGGSPVYLVFAGMMGLLWISLILAVRTGMLSGWFRLDVRLARATSLLLAMLMVQAVFEPDYGSYIKHLTPLLPLFFFALRARRRSRGDTGTHTYQDAPDAVQKLRRFHEQTPRKGQQS